MLRVQHTQFKKLIFSYVLDYSFCHRFRNTFFERTRDNFVFGRILYKICEIHSCLYFHFICNLFYFISHSSEKNSREHERIIYLIWKITTTCCYDSGSCLVGEIWHDFWSRVCHGKYHWARSHRLNHFFGEDISF